MTLREVVAWWLPRVVVIKDNAPLAGEGTDDAVLLFYANGFTFDNDCGGLVGSNVDRCEDGISYDRDSSIDDGRGGGRGDGGRPPLSDDGEDDVPTTAAGTYNRVCHRVTPKLGHDLLRIHQSS